MKIYSIHDGEFAPYGKVLGGYDTKELPKTLDAVTSLPEGVDYVPCQSELEALPIADQLTANANGGMSALKLRRTKLYIRLNNTLLAVCTSATVIWWTTAVSASAI